MVFAGEPCSQCPLDTNEFIAHCSETSSLPGNRMAPEIKLHKINKAIGRRWIRAGIVWGLVEWILLPVLFCIDCELRIVSILTNCLENQNNSIS